MFDQIQIATNQIQIATQLIKSRLQQKQVRTFSSNIFLNTTFP